MPIYKALTVKQPWAHLIVEGIKPIENRSWSTNYRGPLLIHAGRAYDHTPAVEEEFNLDSEQLQRGAIIGIVDLIDIVTDHPSPFFSGPFGWVLRNPRRISPHPTRGQLGLFELNLELATRPVIML